MGRAQRVRHRARLVQRGEPADVDRAVTLANRVIEARDDLRRHALARRGTRVEARYARGRRRTSPAPSIDAVSVLITIDRPDLRKYAAADGHVTFCFSDVVGYTTMTERLGYVWMHEVLGVHNAVLRETL